MSKKLYVVGPHNCPARRDRICLMSGEECQMLYFMVGAECMFFEYELREKKRQLRLKHKKEKGMAKWL